MKQRIISPLPILVLSVLFVLVLFSGACGGGSRGTGGSEYRGVLAADSAAIQNFRAIMPLAGIKVTIGETGDFDISDENGAYSIRTRSGLTSVEYFFEGPDINTSYRLENIPANATAVVVDFTVDQNANTVQAGQAIFESDGGQGSSSSSSDDGQGSSSSSSDSSDSGSSSSSSSNGGSGGSSSNGGNGGNGGGDSSSSQDEDKITICHKPNSKNPSTITVSQSALDSHLGHGDTIGPCP